MKKIIFLILTFNITYAISQYEAVPIGPPDISYLWRDIAAKDSLGNKIIINTDLNTGLISKFSIFKAKDKKLLDIDISLLNNILNPDFRTLTDIWLDADEISYIEFEFLTFKENDLYESGQFTATIYFNSGELEGILIKDDESSNRYSYKPPKDKK